MMFKRLGICTLIVSFLLASFGPLPEARAQTILNLPAPGTMVNLSNSFNQMQLKGMRVDVNKPLSFDFILDKGENVLSSKILNEEVTRLSKYFLTALTVPSEDMWVNLSPYEKERVAADGFGRTQMGKDLLEQDYLLKQIAASMLYPESSLGKSFWREIYSTAQQQLHTTQMPIEAFHKVWIVPKSATVLVRGSTAYVSESTMDVMLDSDYLALRKNDISSVSQFQSLYMNAFKKIILPRLRQEINQGKNFATVRQAYGAMVLAVWYKKHLKESFLAKAYVSKNKIVGVDVDDVQVKERIYQQYLQSFRKNVFNYIKEESDPMTGITVPRKYVSGGFDFTGFRSTALAYQEKAMLATTDIKTDNMAMASIDVVPQRPTSIKNKITGIFARSTPLVASVVIGIVGMAFSMPTFAKIEPAGDGTVTVSVQPGKTYSHAVEELRMAMKSSTPATYEQSIYSGNFYGKQSVMSRLNVASMVKVMPGQKITFSVPADFVKSLKTTATEAVAKSISVTGPTVTHGKQTIFHDASRIKLTQNITVERQAAVPQPTFNAPTAVVLLPEISDDILVKAGIGLALATAFGIGALAVKKIIIAVKNKKAKGKISTTLLRTKRPVSLVILGSEDDKPALEDEVELKHRSNVSKDGPIFEGVEANAPAPASTQEGSPQYIDEINRELSALAAQPMSVKITKKSFASEMFETLTLWWLKVQHHLYHLPVVTALMINSSDIWQSVIQNFDLFSGNFNFACGIILFGRVAKAKELAAQGDKKFLDMMSKAFKILSSRGIHSAGIWGIRRNAEGVNNSTLIKKMKGKRFGRNIVEDMFKDLAKNLPGINVGAYKTDEFVMDAFFGHSRWATGGKVTIKATHPHLGASPAKMVWSIPEGELKAGVLKDIDIGISDLTKDQEKDAQTVIYDGLGHNGDNDFYRFKEGEEYLSVREARNLFTRLVHFQGDLPPGDSPLLALQIHYHMTMGVWSQAVRFAHVETHLKTFDERSVESLTEDEENLVGADFDAVFSRYAKLLSRPKLNKLDKSFKDLWVDEKMLAEYPQLQGQYKIIKDFKKEIASILIAKVHQRALPQSLIKHLHRSDQLEENVNKFVDLAVERFFTGDRRKANEEVMWRVKGTYGYYSYSSLEPKGFTLVSRQQPAVFGYNTETGTFAAASTPDTLLVKDQDGNGLKELIYLNDKGNGEMMDFNVSGITGEFRLRFINLATGEDTKTEERRMRTFTLDEKNPYFTKAEKEIDERTRIIADINSITPMLAKAGNDWENPNSFNRQSNALMLERLSAIYIHERMKGHRRYGSLFETVQKKVQALLSQCQSLGGCSPEHLDFLSQEGAQGLERSKSLLMWMIDEHLKVNAKELSRELVTGQLSAQDVWGQVERVIEEQGQRVLYLLNKKGLPLIYQEWEQEKKRAHIRSDKQDVHFLASGYSDTYYISKAVFESIFGTLLPGLVIKVENTNDLLDPLNKVDFNIYDVGVALVASKYGGTFPTAIALDKLNSSMGQENVFVMVGRMHSTMSVKAGQSLNAEAPFTQRVYVTGNTSRSEAGTVSEAALKAHQMHMAFGIVEGLRGLFPDDKPFGLEGSQEDISHDKELMMQSIVQDSKNITGIDRDGKSYANKIVQYKDKIGEDVQMSVNKRLQQRGRKYAKHFGEGTVTQGLFWTYVVGVLPVWGGVFSWVNTTSGSYGFKVVENIATLLVGGIIIPLLYRLAVGTPLGARFGPPPNILLVSHMAKAQDMFLSKLMAQAPKSQASNIHGTSQRDAMAELSPKIQRGSWVEGHFPVDAANQGDFSRVMMQLKTSKYEVPWLFGKRQGAVGNTTSRGVVDDPDHNITDDNIVLGGSDIYGRIRNPHMREVYNKLVDPFGGWLAQKVAYGYAYQIVTFGARTFDPANTTFNTRSHTTEVGQGDRKIPARDAANQAMVVRTSKSVTVTAPTGGIDFDSSMLSLTIKESVGASKMFVSNKAFLDYPILGIVPQVRSIVPMTPDLVREFMGV